MRSAIALVVRDEADWITEHLAYHLSVLGFTRALVYDNGSTDGTQERVAHLARHLQIDLIDWPDVAGQLRAGRQMTAYLDACRRVAGEVDWIAAIDADEFVHSTSGGTIAELLLPQPFGVSQVSLNWAVFGSSGHVEAPIGLALEAYTWRRRLDHPVNRCTKALVRPERVIACGNPHGFEVHGRCVNALGHDMQWGAEPGVTAADPPVCAWRVNHYVLRSRWHWEKRQRRGQFSNPRTELDWRVFDLGEERDLSAPHFYGARLHQALATFAGESIDDLPPMQAHAHADSPTGTPPKADAGA